MARTKNWNVRRTYSKPVMAYLKPDQRRALEAAAESEELPIGTWVRRLIVAELGRFAARERLAQ